jgi:hypothetical protein
MSNLSEEEKEAIENLKSWREYIINHKEDVIFPNEIEFYLRTVLNLIDKQQKEIEDMREELQMYVDTDLIKEKLEIEIDKLKDKNKTLESLLQGNLYEMYLYYKELAGKYQANCISKDKIREIIYGNYEDLEIILLIKELLEE